MAGPGKSVFKQTLPQSSSISFCDYCRRIWCAWSNSINWNFPSDSQTDLYHRIKNSYRFVRYLCLQWAYQLLYKQW